MDPDPGGKNFPIKTEKCKKIGNNCNFIKIVKVIFTAPLFLTFKQSCMFFSTKENSSKGYLLQSF